MEEEEGRGRARARWQSARGVALSARWFDDFQDLGLVPEGSGVRNSLAAQEFGSDWTSPIGVRGYGVGAEYRRVSGGRYSIGWSRQRERALAVHAEPAYGAFEPTVAADTATRDRLRLAVDESVVWTSGAQLRVGASVALDRVRNASAGGGSSPHVRYQRAMIDVELQHPIGTHRVVARTLAGSVFGPSSPESDFLRAQDSVFVGGPISASGYAYHSLSGRSALTQRIEWQARIPFIPIDLGRYGRAPSSLTFAPFLSGTYVDRSASAENGWYPAVGIGVLGLFDLLRLDVARGLRHGGWTVSIDVSRTFWPVL